jgi:excinuclease ABC subunit C
MESEDIELLNRFFVDEFGKHTNVLVPKIGEKKRLASQATANAKENVMRDRREKEKNGFFLSEFSNLLNLGEMANRIEAYDISNSGDEHITASMIVLCDGKFSRGKYRTFNIKSTSGQDDFGAMREALERRMAHKEKDWEYPDLILVDGGAGQVNVVKGVVEKYSSSIAVFGMVKDEHHKTRTLTDGENEISIAHLKDVYTFVYKIQEEAHRVAISRMDLKRRKTYKKSSLENIKGVGEKTAKALLAYFGGLKGIKNATIEELSAVKGVSKSAASAVYEYYNKK